jgi:hypothetical protein
LAPPYRRRTQSTVFPILSDNRLDSLRQISLPVLDDQLSGIVNSLLFSIGQFFIVEHKSRRHEHPKFPSLSETAIGNGYLTKNIGLN